GAAVPGALVAAVERLEALLRLLAVAEAFHVGDAVDLEIHRPGAVGEDVVLGAPRLQVDAVGAAREQVDLRRAEQPEVARVHRVVQAADAAVEQRHDLEFAGRRARQHRLQPGEHREQETLRAGEVFLQQAVAAERAVGVRQQRLVVGKALVADAAAVEELADQPARPRRAYQVTHRVAEQLLVQALGQFVGAGDEQRQLVQRQHVRLRAGGDGELQPQAGAYGLVRRQRHAGGGERGRRLEVLRLGQFQWPQGDVVRGAVFAGGALVVTGEPAQRGLPRHHRTGGQRAFL